MDLTEVKTSHEALLEDLCKDLTAALEKNIELKAIIAKQTEDLNFYKDLDTISDSPKVIPW